MQIGRQLNCHPASVEASVIGEHGTSQGYIWSTARIVGDRVLDISERRQLDPLKFRKEIEEAVKYANIEIINGIGASQHAIGVVTARLVEAILRDERLIAPVGTYQPEYGVTLSLPSIIDSMGKPKVMMPTLEKSELDALAVSAQTLREALNEIKELLPTVKS